MTCKQQIQSLINRDDEPEHNYIDIIHNMSLCHGMALLFFSFTICLKSNTRTTLYITLSYHTTEHDRTSHQRIFKSNTWDTDHKKGTVAFAQCKPQPRPTENSTVCNCSLNKSGTRGGAPDTYKDN